MKCIAAEICCDLLIRSPKAAIPRLSKAVPGIKRALLQFWGFLTCNKCQLCRPDTNFYSAAQELITFIACSNSTSSPLAARRAFSNVIGVRIEGDTPPMPSRLSIWTSLSLSRDCPYGQWTTIFPGIFAPPPAIPNEPFVP